MFSTILGKEYEVRDDNRSSIFGTEFSIIWVLFSSLHYFATLTVTNLLFDRQATTEIFSGNVLLIFAALVDSANDLHKSLTPSWNPTSSREFSVISGTLLNQFIQGEKQEERKYILLLRQTKLFPFGNHLHILKKYKQVKQAILTTNKVLP